MFKKLISQVNHRRGKGSEPPKVLPRELSNEKQYGNENLAIPQGINKSKSTLNKERTELHFRETGFVKMSKNCSKIANFNYPNNF